MADKSNGSTDHPAESDLAASATEIVPVENQSQETLPQNSPPKTDTELAVTVGATVATVKNLENEIDETEKAVKEYQEWQQQMTAQVLTISEQQIQSQQTVTAMGEAISQIAEQVSQMMAHLIPPPKSNAEGEDLKAAENQPLNPQTSKPEAESEAPEVKAEKSPVVKRSRWM